MTSPNRGTPASLRGLRFVALRLFPVALVLGALLLVGACDEDDDIAGTEDQFTQLTAGPQSLALLVGEGGNMVAMLARVGGGSVDANQIGAAVTWTSSNTGVATVDQFGRILALSQGTSTVTGQYRGLSGSATVRVSARPSRIQLTSGSLQGAAGQAIPGGVGVQILDSSGQPVLGLPVRFTVLIGGGSVNPAQTPTGSDGRASTSWTLGRTAGRQALEVAVLRGSAPAAAPGASAPTDGADADPSVGAIVGGGAPLAVGEPDEVLASTVVFAEAQGSTLATAVVITPSSATMRGGDARVFNARVVDQLGNDVPNQSVTFGTSNGDVLTVGADGTAIAKRVGTANVTVTTGFTGVVGSASVTVTSGPVSRVVKISGDHQVGIAGTPLPEPLVVEVQDGGGNPIANVAVHWSVSGGTVAAPTTTTNSAGRASVSYTLGTGASSFTISAAVATLAPATFTQTASSQPTITTATLANATVGVPYNQTLAAAGGTTGYSWSLVSGSLPAGLSLNASTGAITGAPTIAGTLGFTVQVSSGGLVATRDLTITVLAPGLNILTLSLPNGSIGFPYLQTLTASGGSAAYGWAITAGSLPPGLLLNPTTGTISGTPTTNGTSPFTVQVTSGLATATRGLSITIVDPPSDGEPLFNPGTQMLIMQDDMNRYTTATEMGSGFTDFSTRIAPYGSPIVDGRPVNTYSNQVITGRGGSGKALRMAYSGEPQDGPSFDVINAPTTDNNDTHYFQYWARVTYPGAPAAITYQTVAIKWFMAWHRVNAGVRVQWNTHGNWPCPIGPGGTNPLSRSATYWQVYDGSATTACQAMQPVGPYFHTLADGQWHRFTYAYKSHTAAGARNGFAQMWIDGVKVIDISSAACGVTPPGGEKVWCATDDLDMLFVNDGIGTVRWGSTQTDAPTQPWTYDIDDFSWWITP